MKKIVEKRYVRIEFTLSSPLLISSTASYRTDSDVLRNSRNVPYIPGTSVAGVVREALDKEGIDVQALFGKVEKNYGDGNASQTESKVVFNDAVLQDEEGFSITVRDSVKLDQFKTGVDGSKFDMEVLEPGARFVTFMEQNAESGDKNILHTIADLFASGKITFGSKTTRGFGSIGNVTAKEASFKMTDLIEADSWLEFDPYKNDGWNDMDLRASESNNTLILRLELVDGISIRQYTTETGRKNEPAPDYTQLAGRNRDSDTVPVIPGSTWAGAFMHRIAQFGEDLAEYTYEDKEKNQYKGCYFGLVEGDLKIKSQVVFSESTIEGGGKKVLSRTAIDRFSGSAAKRSLYTESAHFGGKCTLNITFKKPMNNSYSQEFINAFAAAVCDLHHGYLAVGGLTAVGRGVFRVLTVNDNPVRDDDLYSTVRDEINNINLSFGGKKT